MYRTFTHFSKVQLPSMDVASESSRGSIYISTTQIVESEARNDIEEVTHVQPTSESTQQTLESESSTVYFALDRNISTSSLAMFMQSGYPTTSLTFLSTSDLRNPLDGPAAW